MSVRVVARIRPLLAAERDVDTIVRATSSSDSSSTATKSTSKGEKFDLIKIPNPKKESEEFSFQFGRVYDGSAAQSELFDEEGECSRGLLRKVHTDMCAVSPTVKHLFNGYDVTIFAYGSTGTGKTHTMRGGKSLADRGVIPRLLSSIFRRAKKIEKDSQSETTVEILMSYYEIYNDRVFDLFEAPEKRNATGLALRDCGGKTVVVGLTERPCGSLKEFEGLYDHANKNRSTGATKLNAHSSRSHAILCVKVVRTTGTETRVSTASAIDLAGSEDNRRTGNGKEQMVESASINRSLFVLAQCVEAISKKQSRIPYRESKMTRILSLGQNNGFTIMILNLAPVRGFHLDTVSSLNFANRTKKIEVREVENEVVFKPVSRLPATTSAVLGDAKRQPLRPLADGVNVNIAAHTASAKANDKGDKPLKAFSVYSDHAKPRSTSAIHSSRIVKRSSPLKRGSEAVHLPTSRPSKFVRPGERQPAGISAANIEEMVEKKVEAILAARAQNQAPPPVSSKEDLLSEAVQKRLDMLEQRIEGSEDARAEGLSYLLMAKQHHVRGESASALRMYLLARPFFPGNAKLERKIERLQEEARARKQDSQPVYAEAYHDQENMPVHLPVTKSLSNKTAALPKSASGNSISHDDQDDYEPAHAAHGADDSDYEYNGNSASEEEDDDFAPKQRMRKLAPIRQPLVSRKLNVRVAPLQPSESHNLNGAASPRTSHLLKVINTRDVSQIRLLKGVGAKKAEAIVDCLCEMDEQEGGDGEARIESLGQLGMLRGVGVRTVESMRGGIVV